MVSSVQSDVSFYQLCEVDYLFILKLIRNAEWTYDVVIPFTMSKSIIEVGNPEKWILQRISSNNLMTAAE